MMDKYLNINVLKRPAFHIFLIILLGLIAYSNTFNVPFQLDDVPLIEKNPIVKNLDYILQPSTAKEHPEYGPFRRRYIGFVTFALNYRIHGLDVRGYHIFNVSLHIANALLIYLFVLLTFKTPYLRASSLTRHSKIIAFFSSIIFVSHPVHIEAVTYIYQRVASLVTFFYVLSLILYIKSRLSFSDKNPRNYSFLMYYPIAISSVVLAVLTKQNSLTLPFAIALYEYFFFNGPLKKRALFILPLFLPLFLFPLILNETGMSLGSLLLGSNSQAPEFAKDSAFDSDYFEPSLKRWPYFITQFRVIVTYLRLLFLPVNQSLIYDYPLFESFFEPEVFLSLLFILSILTFSVYCYSYSKNKNRSFRVISFGIIWFFLTLSVESSILPLPMLIVNYRLYLPSIGMFIAISSGIMLLRERRHLQRIRTPFAILLVILPFIFSTATYKRNNVWKTNISLWEDIVQKTSVDFRGPKTVAHLEVRYNLALAYQKRGLGDKAIELYRDTIKINPNNIDAYNNIGVIYLDKGQLKEAIQYFRHCIIMDRDYANAYFNLGEAYFKKGLIDESIKYYKIFLKYKPDFEDAHNNLAMAYMEKGLIDKAQEHFRIAENLKQQHAED